MSDPRTVVVTGGSGGIGRAICDAFATVGDAVVSLDLAPPEGGVSDGEYAFIRCDVAAKRDVDKAFDEIVRRYGGVDVLVCGAGVLKRRAFLEISEEEWDLVLGVNLKSAFLCGQAAAQRMVTAGKPGAIVNIASIAAEMATETGASYCASKGGVAALTKAMGLALVEHGIRVNAVAPGSVATPMVQGTLEDPVALNRVLSRTPLGRLASPREIADVVAYLASDQASYITSQVIYVDGGRSALNYTVTTS